MKKIITTLFILLLFSKWAFAAETEPVYRIDIPPLDAAEALQLLAQQTDKVILFPYELTENKRARAVYGQYRLAEALALLLEGTGLQGVPTENNIINIVALPPPSKQGFLDFLSTLFGGGSNQGSGSGSEQNKAAKTQGDLEELVITGSRIARRAIDNPTPVAQLEADTINFSGASTLSELVNGLPALALGQGRTTGNFSFNQAGINALNLRGLGTARTLTLVNGRRHVGSDLEGSSALDVSSIPLALVERVEVITGGASAIYGADAVAGVVNFIMKEDFEGLQLDLQSGISSRGDGQQYRFASTLGLNFADYRGNFTAHITALSRDAVQANDRAFSRAGSVYVAAADLGLSESAFNLVTANNFSTLFSSTNAIVANPANGGGPFGDSFYTFSSDLAARPFNAGSAGVFGGSNVINSELPNLEGGNEQFFIATPDERLLINTTLYFDIREDMRLFVEGKFSQVDAQSLFGSVGSFSFVESLSLDNPFIRDDLREIATNAGASSLFVNRTHAEFGPRKAENRRRVARIIAGISGTLAEQYPYQFYYQYGAADSSNSYINDRNDARWFQGLDVIADPVTGQPVCRNPANGCVPINILGPTGTISQAAIDWVRIPSHTSTVELEQTVVAADISGQLKGIGFAAGDIRFAAGMEFREESRVDNPSQVFQQGLGYFGSSLQPLNGRFDVFELFAELSVPLLSNQTLAEELTLEAAIRGADYSTIGGDAAYKLAAIWEPLRGYRLRSTYSRAIRAPNINELFRPETDIGFLNFVTDPCDARQVNNGSANRFNSCQALGIADPNNFDGSLSVNEIPLVTSGNPELENETAHTLTLGLVMRPPGLESLEMSIDYWQIDIDNFVEDPGSTINAQFQQSALNGCVDASSIANIYCSLISRNAAGNITEFRGTPVNLSALKTSGVDLGGSYRLAFKEADMQLNWMLTHTFERSLLAGAEAGTAVTENDNIGELGDPEWRAFIQLIYQQGPLAISLSSRYIGKQQFNVAEADNARDQRLLDDLWYTDTKLAYQLSDSLSIYLGINNLANQQVPTHPYTNPVYGSQFGSGIFDPVGRFFYLGLQFSAN